MRCFPATPTRRSLARPVSRSSGFTLIELMIVIAIIGVLSVIAVASFQKLVRRSKSSEALVNLRRIYDGALTSYLADEVNRAGQSAEPRFPSSAPPTPAENFCCENGVGGKCPPSSVAFNTPVWHELQFSVDDPHYYWYTFVSEGQGVTARFTARASGNLNCDALYSTYERVGFVDLQVGVTGGAGLYVSDALE